MNELKAGIIQRALSYITEEMGIVLRNSAFSPNIRERLDMSCALLSHEGKVIAQAEHIPVHLGSLAWASSRIINAVKDLVESDGDVVVLNDPYKTGTHLNDVTVVTRGPLGWIVNKAHHVDVGGPIPGSLNPNASTLYEEGMVIEPTLVAKGWEILDDVIKEMAREVRDPRVFEADLKAQIASLREGWLRSKEVIERYGLETVLRSTDVFIETSRKTYSNFLRKYEGFEGEGVSILESPLGEIRIHARVSIKDGMLIADFTRSSDQVRSNVNAVEGIAYAATSFLVKSITEPNGPVDHGLYQVIRVKTREGSILNPIYPAAVGAGNLETSQHTLESLLLAISELEEVSASAGPGTMANVIISHGNKVYYETNGGGGSATSYSDGENAVQWGMTNTMNTPIEVIEHDLPILFTSYRVRRGSGGKGRRKGGDGLIRSWKALDKIKVTLMMSRIRYPSPGIGAESGAPGKAYVKRDENFITLNGYDTVTLDAGDEFVLMTPGAGGHK